MQLGSYEEFPAQQNRELIRDNREFNPRNREIRKSASAALRYKDELITLFDRKRNLAQNRSALPGACRFVEFSYVVDKKIINKVGDREAPSSRTRASRTPRPLSSSRRSRRSSPFPAHARPRPHGWIPARG